MRPKIASDEELLDIARTCFLSRGPSISTAYIAEQAGVSQATLFKRFGTKSDLMFKALDLHDVRPWLPRLEAGPDERPIDQQLREFARALVKFSDRALPAMMAFRAAGPGQQTEQLQHLAENGEVPGPIRARLALTRWFEAGQEQGRLGRFDAEATAVAFIGALQAPALRRHLVGDELNLENYADDFIDILWRGIRP